MAYTPSEIQVATQHIATLQEMRKDNEQLNATEQTRTDDRAPTMAQVLTYASARSDQHPRYASARPDQHPRKWFVSISAPRGFLFKSVPATSVSFLQPESKHCEEQNIKETRVDDRRGS